MPHAASSPSEWLTCIRLGSGVSHFSVSLIVSGTVTMRQCAETTILNKEGEAKRNGTEVLLFTSLSPYR